MKKTILFLALLALAGCYKDKGSYDYSPAAKVTITMPEVGNFVLGKPMTLAPTIEPALPEADFDYCWANTGLTNSVQAQFGNAAAYDTIALSKVLTWVPNQVGNNVLRLYVREKRTGVITQAPITVSVAGQFARGWTVLTNVDGRSALSFIDPTFEMVESVKTRRFDPYPDLWATLNPGKSLGTQPEGLAMQFGPASAGGALVYIFQKDSPVVLSGNIFGVERPFNQMFPVAPLAAFHPKEVVTLNMAPSFSVLQSTSGQLFSRQALDPNYVGFYSYLYSAVPVSLDGNDVIADLVPDMDMGSVGGQILVNRARREALFFVKNTSRTSMLKTGLVARFDYTDTPEFDYRGWAADIEPLHFYAGNPSSLFTVIYRKGGKVKWQFASGAFMVAAPFTLYPLKNFTGGEFPAEVEVNESTVFRNLYGGGWGSSAIDPLMFIATGNKIWWFDVNSKMFNPFYTLPAGDQVAAMMDNPQQSELMVATRGGKMVVLDIKRANIMAGQKIWETQLPGTFVDLDYKYANFMSRQLRTADF